MQTRLEEVICELTYAYAYIMYTYVNAYICMHACMSVCLYAYVCMHMYAFMCGGGGASAVHQFAPVTYTFLIQFFFYWQQISVIRLLKAEGAELAQYTSSRLSEQEAQHLEHVARLESEWRAIHTRLEDARREEVCKSVY